LIVVAGKDAYLVVVAVPEATLMIDGRKIPLVTTVMTVCAATLLGTSTPLA
jgi:hypothetical protein